MMAVDVEFADNDPPLCCFHYVQSPRVQGCVSTFFFHLFDRNPSSGKRIASMLNRDPSSSGLVLLFATRIPRSQNLGLLVIQALLFPCESCMLSGSTHSSFFWLKKQWVIATTSSYNFQTRFLVVPWSKGLTVRISSQNA
jgi:hypothetical protein